MTPLRVAFLTYALHLGGAERWILSLCREFDRKRVKPTAIVVNNWKLRQQITMQAVPSDVPVLPTEYVRDQWPAIADVVIGWGKCDLTNNAKGIPAVHCTHGATLCSWTKEAVADALVSGAKLTGVNEACRGVFPEQYRHLMTILPNGADPSRVIPTCGRAEIRASLGIHPTQKVVAHVGRVMLDKDVPALARAVGCLPDDWLLLVCGPLDGNTVSLAAISEAAKGRMIYLKPRDHVGDVLAASDVFCLLSPSEAHPLATNEAWLAGKPVVCTNLPWIASLEREHGELVIKVDPTHDSSEVAGAIQNALVGQELAKKAKRIAEEHYTAKKMAERWERWLHATFTSPSTTAAARALREKFKNSEGFLKETPNLK